MSDPILTDEYPGLDRLKYFLATFGLIFACTAGIIWAGPQSMVGQILNVAMMIGLVVARVYRLKNIGLSQWWSFLMYVPFVNLAFTIFVMAAPPGWAETRRFDRTGYTIIGVWVALVIMIIWITRFAAVSLFTSRFI
jgi:uncharacterized protein DUF805